MTARAYIDRDDTLSLTEEQGVVTGMKRRVRVTNLTSTDYSVLLAGLTQAGVPAQGTGLTGTAFSELVLCKREVNLLSGDPSTVDVDLIYGTILENQNISSTTLTGGILYGKTRCNIQQSTTNLYQVNGQGPVQQVVVGHTYPADDPDFPGQYFAQGGEINVYLPVSNTNYEGYIDTSTPWFTADYLIGTINSETFLSAAPFYWMCTEVQWHRLGVTTVGTKAVPRYKFSFEFQYNPDTWNPFAVFIDDRTGRPPPGLYAPGTQPDGTAPGWLYVPYHRTVNFNSAFAAYFEGFQQA